MKFELRLAAGERQRDVNSLLQQTLDKLRRVAGLDGDGMFRETFLELAQHGRNDVLTCRRAGAQAQSALAPFAEMHQRFARGFHFR